MPSSAPSVPEQSASGFAEALRAVEGVEGWLTDAQARRLWDAAARVAPPGRIVEIGSFRGRSTTILARAAAPGVEVVAIDPHGGNDRGPQEIAPDAARGEEDHRAFRANLERAGVARRVRHVRLPSEDALGEAGDPVDLLYVDGAHRYVPARDDIARYGARVAPGGTLLVHDAFSANGVMLAQLRLLFASDEFRYVGRSGSLAEYRREDLDGRDRVRNAARQVAVIPYWVRNSFIKVALVADKPALARRFGHDTGHWPY
jgi:predicted O-methyltransferase YrrM